MIWKRRPARERKPATTQVGGRITAIRQQERDPNRVSVYLDGEFAFGLSAMRLLAEGLSVGDELPPDRVEALLALDDVGRATEAALRLLAQRPRTIREIRDRLQRRGFPPEAIEATIAKLEDWNYINDIDFARRWVENRERHRPRGRRLLAQELRQKGIDREVVQETLDTAEIDEAATALELGRAKIRSYTGLESHVARRRLAGFLARRGYDGATVRAVTERLLGQLDEDESAFSAPDE